MFCSSILLLSGCISDNICEEKMIKDTSSASGNYVATMFERDCGATTSIFTHINIRSRDENLSKSGSGIVENGLVFSVRGESGGVSAYWQDDETFIILHN